MWECWRGDYDFEKMIEGIVLIPKKKPILKEVKDRITLCVVENE